MQAEQGGERQEEVDRTLGVRAQHHPRRGAPRRRSAATRPSANAAEIPARRWWRAARSGWAIDRRWARTQNTAFEVARRRPRRLVRARLVERRPARFLVQPHRLGQQPIGELGRRLGAHGYSGIRHRTPTISSSKLFRRSANVRRRSRTVHHPLIRVFTHPSGVQPSIETATHDPITSSSRLGRLPASRFRALLRRALRLGDRRADAERRDRLAGLRHHARSVGARHRRAGGVPAGDRARPRHRLRRRPLRSPRASCWCATR